MFQLVSSYGYMIIVTAQLGMQDKVKCQDLVAGTMPILFLTFANIKFITYIMISFFCQLFVKVRSSSVISWMQDCIQQYLDAGLYKVVVSPQKLKPKQTKMLSPIFELFPPPRCLSFNLQLNLSLSFYFSVLKVPVKPFVPHIVKPVGYRIEES